jgi:hypothetical protein
MDDEGGVKNFSRKRNLWTGKIRMYKDTITDTDAKDAFTDTATAAQKKLASIQNEIEVCKSFCFECPHRISKIKLASDIFITRSSITISDKKITLNEKKFRMLCAFKRNENKTVNRDFLLSYIWGADCQNSNNVNVMVSSLRSLLRKTRLEIITIRDKGYLMTYHSEPA